MFVTFNVTNFGTITLARNRIEQGRAAIQTLSRPSLFGPVVFVDRRGVWRQDQPRLFRRRKDVNVGGYSVGIVECSDTNEVNRRADPAR